MKKGEQKKYTESIFGSGKNNNNNNNKTLDRFNDAHCGAHRSAVTTRTHHLAHLQVDLRGA